MARNGEIYCEQQYPYHWDSKRELSRHRQAYADRCRRPTINLFLETPIVHLGHPQFGVLSNRIPLS